MVIIILEIILSAEEMSYLPPLSLSPSLRSSLPMSKLYIERREKSSGEVFLFLIDSSLQST